MQAHTKGYIYWNSFKIIEWYSNLYYGIEIFYPIIYSILVGRDNTVVKGLVITNIAIPISKISGEVWVAVNLLDKTVSHSRSLYYVSVRRSRKYNATHGIEIKLTEECVPGIYCIQDITSLGNSNRCSRQ